MPDGTFERCCKMSVPQVRPLFAAACKTGNIASFRSSLQDAIAKAQAGNTGYQNEEPAVEHPDKDPSTVRGTPEQIKQMIELQDEIQRLYAEAEQKLTMGHQEFRHGMRKTANGNALSYVSVPGQRVYDGHGT